MRIFHKLRFCYLYATLKLIIIKKTYLTLLAVLFIAFQLKADFKTDPKKDEGEKTPARKNLIKINLPTLALRTYALEYERAIGKKTALSIGYRFMPKGAIPMQDRINSLIDDAETSKQLNSFNIGNSAITPQVKFYFGNDIFKGFYLAPFARFATYNATGLFNFDVNGTEEEMPLDGELKTITGGLELGVQFRLGKRIHLNFHAGPQFGTSNGNFAGTKTLSADEQNELRNQLEDLSIPFAKTEVDVNSNGVKMKIDGPWAGFKAGIMLGFRF